MSELKLIKYSTANGLEDRLSESLREIYPDNSPRLHQREQVNLRYFQAAFFLQQNDKIVARAVLYMNPGLSFEGLSTALVGNFESVHHQDYAFQLLSEIESESRESGAKYLIGPMNGSTWDTYRFNVKAKQAFFLEQIHPDFYNALFTDYGFRLIRSYCSTKIDISKTAPDETSRQFLNDKGIFLRPIDLDNYEQELDRIHAFTLEAFRTNFLFSPISLENFKEKYRPVKSIIHPEFTLLALDSSEHLIGCIFCVDDLQNKKVKTLIIKSIARHPEHRWKGLGRLLTSRIHQMALAAGYDAVIHAFMDGTGYSRPVSATFAEEIINEYALYGKKIQYR